MDKEKIVKQNGQFVFDMVKEVVEATGPRLPGSEEEAAGAKLVAGQMERELGVKTTTEKFKLAPRASIGAIPALGMLGALCFLLFYLSPIASLALGVCLFIYAVIQIFMYTGLLDRFFKQYTSQNVYSIVEPKSGKTDYTIMFSGHIDSSWCWNLSLQNPKTMIIKTVLGIVSIGALAIISLVAVCKGAFSFTILRQFADSGMKLTAEQIGWIVIYCLPIICLPGCYWLSNFLSYDKAKASPGAMDNMSGIALSIAATKFFKENPNKCPENCRFICAGLGSEEAGLKGSMAFCDAHKGDKNMFNDNLYVINLDSFRDDDYFNVVKGDIWLFSHFDKNLMKLSLEAMSEAGLKGGVISNPVGGCDSTPFSRAGIQTVTLNAQNPTATSYYHTTKDTVEGLSMFSLEKGFETVMNLVPKIDEYHKSKNKK